MNRMVQAGFLQTMFPYNCHYGTLIREELAHLFHCPIGYKRVELLLVLERLETIA